MGFSRAALTTLLLAPTVAAIEGSIPGSGSGSGRPVTASGVGDPHFKTWDNFYYDMQGECDYVAAHSAALGLEVQIRNGNNDIFPSFTVSMVEAIAIKYGGNTLEMFGNAANRRTQESTDANPNDLINGNALDWSTCSQTSPCTAGNITYYEKGSPYYATTQKFVDAGPVQLTFDSQFNYYMTSDNLPIDIKGLHGNFDFSGSGVLAVQSNCTWKVHSGVSSIFSNPSGRSPEKQAVCDRDDLCDTIGVHALRFNERELPARRGRRGQGRRQDQVAHCTCESDPVIWAQAETACAALNPNGGAIIAFDAPDAFGFDFFDAAFTYQNCLCDYCVAPELANSNVLAVVDQLVDAIQTEQPALDITGLTTLLEDANINPNTSMALPTNSPTISNPTSAPATSEPTPAPNDAGMGMGMNGMGMGMGMSADSGKGESPGMSAMGKGSTALGSSTSTATSTPIIAIVTVLAVAVLFAAMVTVKIRRSRRTRAVAKEQPSVVENGHVEFLVVTKE